MSQIPSPAPGSPAPRVAHSAYRVAQGGSIFNCRSRRLIPGEIITVGPDNPKQCSDYQLPMSAIRDHVMHGYLEPVNRGAVDHPDHFAMDTDRRIGAQDNPAIAPPPGTRQQVGGQGPSFWQDKEQGRDPATNAPTLGDDKVVRSGQPGGPIITAGVPQRHVPPAASAPTPWTLSPQQLAGKSLPELNVMIHDRMSPDDRRKFEPYESIEPAIAHLTRNFNGG